MALPKEPRQKMINLMYLVLTALLALNVSAEILNAFKTVERSLNTTNKTIDASTQTIMKSFEDKKSEVESRTKALEWAPRAEAAVALTADLNKYIDDLKAQILKEADFDPKRKGDSTYKEDNQDVATRIMVEQGKGQELFKRLQKYKTDLAAIPGLDDHLKSQINTILKQIDLEIPPTKGGHGASGAKQTWEGVYFRMVPTVAAMTMLSKFQNDVKTSENKVVALFHEQVGAVKVRFNQFSPLIGMNSNYLMPGQELQITAGLGAFSKERLPEITIAGQRYPVDPAEGIATFKTVVQGNGTRTIPILIRYQDQDGNWKTIPKEVTYTVGQANAAIALPEMNVLYIGYPNKITVSAGGVGAERIRVSASGGGASISGSNGNYIVNVSQQTDNCLITASTTEGKALGAISFRVRQMPTPIATVGGLESGAYVRAATLNAQSGVGAYIKNFPLNIQYKVSKFTLVGTDENGDLVRAACTGNTFSPAAKRIMGNLQPGDLITVEDIYCTDPSGRNMKVPPLLYNIE